MTNIEAEELYNDIIYYSINNPPVGQFEVHHIIPRGCGGTDDPNNLVSLSIEYHIKCHILLPYFVEIEYVDKMVLAAAYMLGLTKFEECNLSEYIKEITHIKQLQHKYMRTTATAKLLTSNKTIGRVCLNDPRWKTGEIVGYRYGSTTQQTTKDSISKSLTGRVLTEKTKNKMSKAKTGKAGAKDSQSGEFLGNVSIDDPRWKTGEIVGLTFGSIKDDKTRQKMSDAWKHKSLIECPHCGKTSKSMSNMKRWHFNNCKNKDES